ncbi:MAG: hypothetical protein A2788_01890 [Candidatus Abawacabacteria bacterium RIFCSPHIGHO2_01_FULL_46_8]|uniref:Pyruvate kinase n=1 Tax=Candidatus Abawacabacteria bacterium RIFCSPHIGHO2_01_FULL_46_8 TaxID=1817815 RepID=A0A1F4XLZ8_9BACT|nr:MAG: hypothetical protein A2788_01890 [Candidatus Abawacabacteria bacterium RIFCSPHIGHO2_01_FULL_46_8]
MALDIVVSIGPESSSVKVLTELIKAGGTVFRFNYSHQLHEVQAQWLANLRKAEKQAGKKVKTMQDVQGFKIRLGNIKRFDLKEGEQVILDSSITHEEPDILVKGELLPYDGEPIYTGSPIIPRAAQVGSMLYVGDGNLGFKVVEKPSEERLVCTVVGAGELGVHKALTLANEVIEEKALTFQDYENIKLAAGLQYDYLAISFTQTADDITDCRDFIERECGDWRPQIIAKIETKLGLQNLAAIVDVVDGIMVARGDLALHTDFRELYLHERRIIELCKQKKKYCIVATQMLESLKEGGLIPGRAEIIDIATAAALGANATMLSGETTVGAQPVHVVATMRGILEATEKGLQVIN